MDFGRIGALAGTVAGLLSGKPPGLVIDGIVLAGKDSPAAAPFGGEHRHHVHRLPGGARIVDMMGRDDRVLEFTGKLWGGGAATKARRLDLLRASGRRTTLTWADFTRSVVVVGFEADYTTAGQVIPYRLVCLVVQQAADLAAPAPRESIGSDIAKSLGLTELTPALQAAQDALAVAQKAMPVVGVLAPKLAGQVAGYLASANSATGGLVAASEGKLSGFASAGATAVGAFGGSAGRAAAARIVGASAAAANLADAAATLSYGQRAETNARAVAANG